MIDIPRRVMGGYPPSNAGQRKLGGSQFPQKPQRRDREMKQYRVWWSNEAGGYMDHGLIEAESKEQAIDICRDCMCEELHSADDGSWIDEGVWEAIATA